MNKTRQGIEMVLALLFGTYLVTMLGPAVPPFFPGLEALYIAVLWLVTLALSAKIIARIVIQMIRDPKE